MNDGAERSRHHFPRKQNQRNPKPPPLRARAAPPPHLNEWESIVIPKFSMMIVLIKPGKKGRKEQ